MNETESANVAIETATAQVRPARPELRKHPVDPETAATHTPIVHVLRLLNETLVAMPHLLRQETAMGVVGGMRIQEMRDIAVIARQDMMTGMMIGIGGEMIGIAETGIGTETGTGMQDTARVVAGTLLAVGKGEEDQHQGYNLQAHRDHIVRTEARVEDTQDRRISQHSQRTAIGMRFGPCSGLWTRTVSDAEGIANVAEEEHAS